MKSEIMSDVKLALERDARLAWLYVITQAADRGLVGGIP